MNARILFVFAAFLLSGTFAPARAALPFGSGYYTNLCGTGTAATADTCNKGCNPATGTCTSEKPYVIKWTCNGNMQDCRLNESGFANTQNIGNTACGQTVSIQVFNRNCRTYFGWICNDANLQDSMLWYSGDCQNSAGSVTPTLTPTGSAQSGTTACEELTATKGNNTVVPAAVTLHAKASPSGSSLTYRYFFGDGTHMDSSNPDITHTYDVSGPFVARAEVRDTSGAWISSPRCETTVTVKPSSLETHKSDCSDLFIVEGNNTQAPTTVSLRVTGYDNKGSIKKYGVTSSDGQSLENATGAFQLQFSKAGTYTVKGSVTDSSGAVKTGTSGSCENTVSVNTAALKSQPDTGTPTWFSIVSLVSGITGFVLLFAVPSRRTAGTKRAVPARKRNRRRS